MATSSAMNTSNQYIKYQITVTQNSQSVSNNTSNVTVSVRFYRTNTGYTTYGTGTVYCKINGTTYTASVTTDQKITNSGIVLFSKTLNIPHNSDGTKTLATSAWISHSQFTATEQSYSQVLTTIPRATTPVLSTASPTIGDSITITLNRASTSFTHTLTYTFGNASGTIGTGITTSKTWTVPESLADQIPSGTSGTGTIVCTTYNGSTLIGSKTVSFTAYLSSADVPKINSVSITEADSGISSKFGAFVQNRSMLNVSINASASTGATITNYTTWIQSIAYNGNSFTSALITASGNIGVLPVITDSRGKTTQQTQTISVLPYSSPTITTFNPYRANSSGTATDDGTYLKVEINFSISPINNLNDKSYKIEYKKTSDDTWTTMTTGSVYSLNTSKISSSGVLDVDYAYNIRLTITDYFGSVTAEKEVSTSFTLMDFRSTGKGMAIGKASEQDRLEVAMESDFTKNVRIYAPTATGSDDAFLRFVKNNGNLLGFLSTYSNGSALKIAMYNDSSGSNVYSGYVAIKKDGSMESSGVVNGKGAKCITSYGSNLSLTTNYQKIALSCNIRLGSSMVSDNGDGGIKVNRSGYVMVSAQASFRSLTTGDSLYLAVIIGENNISSSTTEAEVAAFSSSAAHSFAIAPQILSVSEGDVLYLCARNTTSARGQVFYYPSSTYLTLLWLN